MYDKYHKIQNQEKSLIIKINIQIMNVKFYVAEVNL